MQNTNNNFLTLSQLATLIRQALQTSFPNYIWVKAEMVKLNVYTRSGHAFPDLIEKNNGQVIAKINATIWANDLSRIQYKFKTVTGKDITDGINVLSQVEVKYHESYGLSLRIIDIDPDYTLGQMALQKNKAIHTLKAEGLFDSNKKLAFPEIPSRLAVISIDTSRGYKDLLSILHDKGIMYRCNITLFAAVLQGEKAVETISKRLIDIEKRKSEFDVILIIRGGGDEAGMDCYDNYNMAKLVATSSLPVITGIGHSTNETVVEMVAHSNKITPTDVAYFLISKYIQQMNIIDENFGKLVAISMMYFSTKEVLLEEFAQRSIRLCNKRFSREYEKLAFHRSHIMELPQRIVSKQKQTLATAENILEKQPEIILKNNKKDIEKILKDIEKVGKFALQNIKSKIERNEQKVNLLSPETIMKRGYSLTLQKGKIIRSTNKLNIGEQIETRLNDGTIISTINKTNKNGKS